MRLVVPRPVLVAVWVACLAIPRLVAGQDAAPPLTDAQIEEFLLKGRVLSLRDAGAGVTNSQRARLSDGQITHDAHVQAVDIARPVFEAGAATELNFKDTYRFNIAGYRLARLIGLSIVPVSVERNINGKTSAVTWWVDDVVMDEKDRIEKKASGPDVQRTARQIQVMRIWDELIQNRDRNQGNVLWTKDWTMWLIDHTRAFRLGKELLKPDQLSRCDRQLLASLRAMTKESLEAAVGSSLTSSEREAVLERRDRLVRHFDERVKRFGEAGVLFDL
jgi:hypothetical protein